MAGMQYAREEYFLLNQQPPAGSSILAVTNVAGAVGSWQPSACSVGVRRNTSAGACGACNCRCTKMGLAVAWGANCLPAPVAAGNTFILTELRTLPPIVRIWARA